MIRNITAALIAGLVFLSFIPATTGAPRSDIFEPENDLERSLVKAATDPAHRPQFYRDLLDSSIFVITQGSESMKVRDGVLQEEAPIRIQALQRDGETWLPIFSSLSRLEENLRSEARYVRMDARDFFSITRGADVILNPNLEYGKEFAAAEIESLLDGSIFRTGQEQTIGKGTKVMLGQPSVYPTELVEALSRLFAGKPNVEAAYLAQFFDPAVDETAHLLIGLDVETDLGPLLEDAGMVASDILPDGEFVDFVQVSPGDSGVSGYMLRETEPFYTRRD